MFVLNVVFCGSFGTSMAIFAIHFVFRYLIMKGNKTLTASAPLTILVWLLIPIGYGVVWSMICMTTLFPTHQTDEFLRQTYLQDFPGKVEDLTYFGPYFYPNGKLDWKPCLGIAGCSLIMSLSSITMIYCGFKCYNRIHNLVQVATNQSNRYRKLQAQFLSALIIETLVPVFLMHIPAAVAYSTCLLDCSHPIIGNILTMSIALYPAVDPLPTIIIISSYRNAVLKAIGCLGNRVNCIQNIVEAATHPVDTEETEMEVL